MTMEKQQTTGVDLYAGRGEGIVEIDEGARIRNEDLSLPILRIVQPTSVEGTEGTFYRGDTMETLETLDVVPLALQPVRTKFPAGKFSRSAKPECWSDDDVRPSTRGRRNDEGETEFPLYSPGGEPVQNCATCPERVSFGGGENREQGKCLPSYMAAFMDAETFETYLLRLQSFNTRLAKMFVAKPHLRKAIIRLWLEEQTNDSGSYYTMKASAQRKCSEDQLEIVQGAFDQLRGHMEEVAGTDDEGATAPVDVAQPEPVQATVAPPPAPPAAPPKGKEPKMTVAMMEKTPEEAGLAGHQPDPLTQPLPF